MHSLKEAIVELYLAIKIRSAEELDSVDEKTLKREREKLMKKDCFIVLEYIRSSIEIIMSMKIDDLEQQEGTKARVSESIRQKMSGTQSLSSLKIGQGCPPKNPEQSKTAIES